MPNAQCPKVRRQQCQYSLANMQYFKMGLAIQHIQAVTFWWCRGLGSKGLVVCSLGVGGLRVQTPWNQVCKVSAKCLQSPYNLTTRYLRYIFIMGQLKSFKYDISSPDFGWTHEEFDTWTISWQTLDTLLLYCIKIIIRFCLTLTY